jgi:hypothetical protein
MQFRSHARKILAESYVAEASRKLLLERDGEGGPVVTGGNGRFGLSSYSGVDRPCAENDVSSPSYLVTPSRAN